MSNPKPDEHGRYRVRRKGDTQSGAWSTRLFDPDRHVVVAGPASDTYGNAWPEKPHRRLFFEPAPENVDLSEVPDNTTTTANPDEESKS